jgi:hypothetical protein
VVLPSVKNLTIALARLSDADWGAGNSEAPIFLLSTGWRTGSTLLQRILVTDPRLFLWGEPFGEMAPVSRITEMLGCASAFSLLREFYIKDSVDTSSLATSWIANLYPRGDDFRLGLRSLFDRWMGDTARRQGFDRWGFKEVRLGATEAVFLHWLYPLAKFVVITRNPFDCYRSLTDAHWSRTYFRCPDIPVDSAAAFARHWNRLVLSWSELPPEFPSYLIKYEDLLEGSVDFRKLEAWLGLEVDERLALSASIGATTARKRLSLHEEWIIKCEAKSGIRLLGYSK